MSLATVEVLLALSFGVLVLIDLIGNTLVILVVLGKRYMQSPMNYLLVNLAVADIVIGLFVLPQYVLYKTFEHPRGAAGDWLCKFVTGGNFIWVGGAASLFTLISIAFDRFFAILYPCWALGKITTRKLRLLIMASWAFAAMKDATPFFIMNYDAKLDFCMERWSDLASARVFTAVIFVINSLTALSLIGYLYARIVYGLWFGTISERDPCKSALLRARKKITKMILIVTVMYGLFWTPVVVLYFLAYYDIPNIGYGSVAYNTSVLFVCLNSSLNPFVYSFHNERFRTGLRDLFKPRSAGTKSVSIARDVLNRRGLRKKHRNEKRTLFFIRWSAKVDVEERA